MRTIKFKQWTCNVNFAFYENGRTAILLKDQEDNSTIATATINVVDIELKEDEVIIKDYSENKGILDALLKANIIEHTGEAVRLRYDIVPICRLLINKELINNEN